MLALAIGELGKKLSDFINKVPDVEAAAIANLNGLNIA